jgi:hypothetical protein
LYPRFKVRVGEIQVENYRVFKVGFEVLTAVSIALMMEAARTSETLVNFYQTTRRYNPDSPDDGGSKDL